MSNIGTKLNILNKQLNVVITNGTKEQLKAYETSKTSVKVKNALIISVQTDNNGDDIPGSVSLWMTDSDGFILQLTNPIGS